MIRSDRQLTSSAFAETIWNNKVYVSQILHNNFNIQKGCAKMVEKFFKFEQKVAKYYILVLVA